MQACQGFLSWPDSGMVSSGWVSNLPSIQLIINFTAKNQSQGKNAPVVRLLCWFGTITVSQTSDSHWNIKKRWSDRVAEAHVTNRSCHLNFIIHLSILLLIDQLCWPINKWFWVWNLQTAEAFLGFIFSLTLLVLHLPASDCSSD